MRTGPYPGGALSRTDAVSSCQPPPERANDTRASRRTMRRRTGTIRAAPTSRRSNTSAYVQRSSRHRAPAASAASTVGGRRESAAFSRASSAAHAARRGTSPARNLHPAAVSNGAPNAAVRAPLFRQPRSYPLTAHPASTSRAAISRVLTASEWVWSPWARHSPFASRAARRSADTMPSGQGIRPDRSPATRTG